MKGDKEAANRKEIKYIFISFSSGNDTGMTRRCVIIERCSVARAFFDSSVCVNKFAEIRVPKYFYAINFPIQLNSILMLGEYKR